MLITAIHNAGLVTLTHRSSPMKFLTEILKRLSNEKAFLLLPVGYPAKEVYVPAIERKSLEDYCRFLLRINCYKFLPVLRLYLSLINYP